MSDKISKNFNIVNRRAGFEYFFIEEYEAGMVLTGTEIKSIREGKVNIQDAYCVFHNDELFVRNLHISPYTEGTHYNHQPLRDRKLLLKRRELKKLADKLKDQGLTIIPIRIFNSPRGLAKIKIALAKGKKLYDKRETIKEKDLKRESDRSGSAY